MNQFVPVLMFVLVVALVIAVTFGFYARSREILRQWAEGNGLTILASERRFFRRGPFFWTTSRGQDVYYVTVRTAAGDLRSGYVRCGGFWLGVFSDTVQVKWDDE